MKASIPGENGTNRHGIALAALPFFLSFSNLIPASKSSRMTPEESPWYEPSG